jgi:hypothetical protein
MRNHTGGLPSLSPRGHPPGPQQMTAAGPIPTLRQMTNREKIEHLRRDVSVDYAFGVAGLLVVADAVDELTARVAALEERSEAGQAEPLGRGITDGDIVSALDDLGRTIEKLAKSLKKSRPS